MSKTNRRVSRLLWLIVCVAMTAALIVCISGCANTDKTPLPSSDEITDSDRTVIGEGEIAFDFSVYDADGTATHYRVHTDKTVVGEALEELSLIAGEEGPFGLYVKTVDGITYDYGTHGKYWAFYADDTLSPVGVDQTDIAEGGSYAFRAE